MRDPTYPAPGDESSVDSKHSGVKVLVIDDSNTIRRSAEVFLTQAGYDVILAEDGFRRTDENHRT